VLWSEQLIAAGDPDFEWPELDENLASGLCFTSGTTGKPKGVLYSHRANILAAFSVSHNYGWAISREDTILALPNFHHANGWGVPFFAAILGAKLVLPGRAMDSASLHELIVGEGVTVTGGVPTVFIKLVEYCKATNQGLGRLNRIFFGGSSQPHGFAGLLKRDYGIVALNAWGMTETTIACTIKVLDPSPEAASQPRQSQGKPIFGVEIRVVDKDGAPLARDGKSQGRLQIKGPWITSEYYRSDAPVSPEGWMETGDLAVISPENELRIMDRDKDVIKSGGEWISSLDLEAATLKYPGVREAAAIAVPHEQWIERPLLIVVASEGVTAEAIRLHLQPLFPKFWMPDEILLVESLPYSASSGKLQKETLRAHYHDRYAARRIAQGAASNIP
jgi:acyl-CoA synthetase (AMP-forming)/AMP-acid ligase II